MGVTAGFVGRLVDRIGRRQVILVTGAVTALFVCAEAVAILSGARSGCWWQLAALQGATIPPDLGVDARALVAARARGDARERLRVRRHPARAGVRGRAADRGRPRHGHQPGRGPAPVRRLLPRRLGRVRDRAGGAQRAPRSRSSARARERCARPACERSCSRARSPPCRSGALEVALPAFAEEEGSRGAVGPLITLWSIGSVIGGLWYGSRSWSWSVEKRFLILMALLGLGSAPLPFAPSIGGDGPAARAHRMRAGAARDHRVRAGRPARAAGHADRGLLVADRRERDGRRGRLADRRRARREASVEWALATAGIACAAGFLVAVAGRRSLRPRRGRRSEPRRLRAGPAPRPAWRACAGQPPRSGECARA